MNVSQVGMHYFGYAMRSLLGGAGQGQGIAQGDGSQGQDQVASQLFSLMDTDGDGSISQSELTAALQQVGPPPMPPMMMEGLALSSGSETTHTSSTDGSSLVSSLASQVFSQVDANGDGSITEAELKAAMEKMHHRHHHHHAEAAGGQSQTLGTAFDPSSLATQLFSLADTDQTGSITEAQLEAALEKVGTPPWLSGSEASSTGAAGTDANGLDLSTLLGQLIMQGGLYAYQSGAAVPADSQEQALSVTA